MHRNELAILVNIASIVAAVYGLFVVNRMGQSVCVLSYRSIPTYYIRRYLGASAAAPEAKVKPILCFLKWRRNIRGMLYCVTLLLSRTSIRGIGTTKCFFTRMFGRIPGVLGRYSKNALRRFAFTLYHLFSCGQMTGSACTLFTIGHPTQPHQGS